MQDYQSTPCNFVRDKIRLRKAKHTKFEDHVMPNEDG